MFSKKATKIDKLFTVDLMLSSKRQIDGEDNFRGLLRKYELYLVGIICPLVELPNLGVHKGRYPKI